MKDPIGDRMKANYEDISRVRLTRRVPVIGRIDGRAFHTLTKGMNKPFDEEFMNAMTYAAAKVAKEVQGCKLAYVQSDEISLLLTDYENLETDAWFKYNLQKMCSVAASIATLYFNFYLETATKHKGKSGCFDARFFNVPKEEVCNYFIWRQKDATRNSIQLLAQSQFSHKALQGLSASELQDKLVLEKGINWNDLETRKRRGSCIINGEIDTEIPVFTQDRRYIERFVFLGEV